MLSNVIYSRNGAVHNTVWSKHILDSISDSYHKENVLSLEKRAQNRIDAQSIGRTS